MRHHKKLRGFVATIALAAALLLIELPGWHGDGRVAEGQTTTVTLLDNFSANAAGFSARADVVVVGTQLTTEYKKSGSFTTGSNPAGYIVDQLSFRLVLISGSIAPAVAIHDDSGGNPGTVKYTLSPPSTTPAYTTANYIDVTFTAPTNATLDPDTTYHVVYSEGTSGASWWIQHTKFTHSSGVTMQEGWSFPAAGRDQTGTAAWDTLTDSRTPYMKLEGTVVPNRGVTVSKTSIPLTEGGDDTYTVVLDSQPSADVTVTPSSDDDGVTVSGALTFTSSNWETAQTVTVTAVEDDDIADITTAITHLVTSTDTGYSGIEVDDVAVTVTDDDEPGVTVSGGPLTITEGGSDDYTVVLTTQPLSTESVTITPSSNGMLVTFNPASVTFDDDDWNQPKTINVTAIQDPDLEDDSDTITNAVTGYTGFTGNAGSVTVTINDDDTASITQSTTSLPVAEGGSSTYTLVLDHKPSGNVTVTITQPTNTDVTVDTDLNTTGNQNTLEFTTSNWQTAQTVTVSAAEDADTDPDTATIVHAVSGANYGSATINDITVNVTDNDNVGVTVSPQTVEPVEGGSGKTYTVVLNSLPTADVTITPSGTGLTITPSPLTFTTGNWNTEQTVTVTAPEDDNLVDEVVTITHSISSSDSNYNSASVASVTANVDDNDMASVIITPTNNMLTVPEGNAAGVDYTVKLSNQPNAQVTIAVNHPSGTDLTIDKTSLVFSTTNWNTAQSVNVKAAEDPDSADDTATISHTATGAEYQGISVPSMVVTVDDDDTDGLTITPTSLPVNEGSSGTYTVVLDTVPSGNVTVTLSVDPSGEVTLGGVDANNRLTFTTDNWSTEQTVTVTADQDDDAFGETVTISHTVAGYNAGSPPDVTVTVTDDDTKGIVVTDATDAGSGTFTTTVTEGSTRVYKLSLASEPYPSTGTVTVGINVPMGTDVTASTDELTFTKDDWDTEKPVTLTASEDADAVNDDFTITHTVSGADYTGVSTPTLDVRIEDNDTANLVISETSIPVTETNADITETYTVKLATQPTANVTVTLSSNNSDVEIDDTSLDFTTSNWNTAQTVTLTIKADDDAADESATITHTASGGDYGSLTGNVMVNIDDDEEAKLLVSSSSVTVAETQTTSVTLTLSAQPTSNVTVSVMRDAVGLQKLGSIGQVILTPSNWETGESIDITSSSDDDGEDDTASLSFTMTGASEFANSSLPTPTVTVNITDRDPKGLEFRESDFDNFANQEIDITEGQSKTYAVRLLTQPTGDVTVTPSSNHRISFTPTNLSLTFTTGNWDTYQEITFRATHDNDAHDPTATITHTFTGYGTFDTNDEPEMPTVLVDIDDDDVVDSTVAATLVNGFLEVGEGDATGNTFTVVLTSSPIRSTNGAAYNTVLTFTPPSGLTVTPLTLTFTGSNWNVPQTFTVKATEDDDGVDQEFTLTGSFGTSGSDYNGTSTDPIMIKVIDDDEPGFVISQTAVEVDEGKTNTNMYTIKPSTQPSGSITVSFSSDNDEVSTAVAEFTFNAGNWMTAQQVDIVAASDDDAQHDTAIVSHVAAMSEGAREYDGVTGDTVTVSVFDDDDREVTFIDTVLDGSTHTISVNEGGSSTYKIRLTSAPYPENGTVTVTINDPSNTDITADPASVQLTSSNWNTGADVTVSMAEDADTTLDTDTITHTVSGADYGDNNITAPDVRVDTTDNDTEGVFISESSVNPTEGSTDTYQIKLNTQPTGTVTVTASSNNSDVTLSHSSLTFTSTTWNTLQTVTVTAAEDADAAEDTATITHGVSGAEYNSAPTPAPVAVTVAENDTLDITVAPTTVPINEVEGGTGTGQYMITLSAAPSGGNATIQITSSGDTNVTTNPTSVTFSASEWATPTTPSVSKTVTINVSDDLDAVDETATLTHAVTGSDYQSEGITADPVTVEVTDTDTAGVTVSVPDITVVEGSTGTYTIVLDTQPTGDVVVTINDPSNTVITADPSQLTFTALNWNVEQDVTVNALADPDANNDEGTITHEITSGPGEYPTTMTIASVDVTSTDGDTRGVEIDVGDGIEVEEGISTDTYQVRLDTEPSGTVTITTSSDNSDVSTNPGSLTFDENDWDSFKTFEVTAIDDADAAADSAVISHTVSGADYGDNNVTAGDVDVIVFDGDNAEASVSTETLTVIEGQGAGYTIVLDSRPVGGDVTVTLTPPTNPDITLDQTTLTFTSVNWDTAQTITVTATADPDTQVDRGTIRHTISGANFAGATLPDVAVTVTETSVIGIEIEPTEFDVGEGESKTYTVNLATLPSGNVTIAVVVKDNPDVTVNPSSLTFTGTTWNDPQTVTVSAATDTDAQNDVASISHTASGFEYAGVTGSDVVVTVIEDGTSVRNTSSFLRSSTCDGKVFLSWNAPVEGEEIATFTIEWSTADTNGEVEISDPEATSYELTGLTNGVVYTVRITGYSAGDVANNLPRKPLWTREIMTVPSDDSCITDIKFGNILADSAPVIVEVGAAEADTQVNMRYRSLNPGVWSEVQSKNLPEGETSVTFGIRGLRPSSNYEVQAWLGSSTPPTADRANAPEDSVTQRVFTSGELPEGVVFTSGGSSGGRILRIEPQISGVTVGPGDKVLLSVDVWGRQDILDNQLADKAPADGRPEFTWFTYRGGSFSEANIRAEWSNGVPDDRAVLFTAPSVPGTFTVEASIDDTADCVAIEGEDDDQQTARCTAQFQITVLRRSEPTISTTAPVNPAGTIPETLTDSDGVAHAVFTPVEGGSFVGDGYSISAGPGAVAKGEFIGIAIVTDGSATNVGQTWHRYTLSGLRYSIRVVDSSGQAISEYSLRDPARVCAPMPPELRSNVSDVVLVSFDDGNFTVLSTRVRITPDGIEVCGNLSVLPTIVAVGKVGPPAVAVEDDDEAEASLEDLPDTGGSALPMVALILILVLGLWTMCIGLTALRRRHPMRSGRFFKGNYEVS